MNTSDKPWLRNYAPGVPDTVPEQQESLNDLLRNSARRYSSQVALDFYGATTSYAELDALVGRAAEALRRLGVAKGDRVALILPNCPQHVVAFYAALRLGAIVVEHNPLYTPEEFTHQLADHGARIAVVWDKAVPVIQKIAPDTEIETIIAVDLTRGLPRLKRWALLLPVAKVRATRAAMTAPAPGALSWETLVADSTSLAETHPWPTPDDIALLQYTGGTTGTPKGAILTHRNLRTNAAQGRAWVPGLIDGAETVYAVLPLFHAYGLTLCLTFAMDIGATLVLFPRFDVNQLLEAARRRPPTFLPAVPPIYQRLAAAARERGVDLTSIRYAISGAMALPPATVELWESVTSGLLVEGYGMTETSPVALGNPVSTARRPGTVGVPFPSTEIRIVDPENPSHDVEQGKAGELLIRGPQVFAGYWHMPEETARVLLPDGWVRTGDVVVMDPDGFVKIVDRIKELIITGGFNVYPSEVEEVLRGVAGITDAAVVGVIGPDGGEQVVAAVVLDKDAAADEAEIRAVCRQHLAGYKVPRRVVVIEDLPRSQIGKILRREVRQRLIEP